MPLNTEIMRDGEARIVPWDYFTLSCMYTVAIKEGAPNYEGLLDSGRTFGELEDGEWIDFSMCYIYGLDIPGVRLLSHGIQTVKERHVFNRNREFDDDGNPIEPDLLIFEPGDVLHAYRSHKR